VEITNKLPEMSDLDSSLRRNDNLLVNPHLRGGNVDGEGRDRAQISQYSRPIVTNVTCGAEELILHCNRQILGEALSLRCFNFGMPVFVLRKGVRGIWRRGAQAAKKPVDFSAHTPTQITATTIHSAIPFFCRFIVVTKGGYLNET
jgi:hypothetical protein